jgi:hypothetical protein
MKSPNIILAVSRLIADSIPGFAIQIPLFQDEFKSKIVDLRYHSRHFLTQLHHLGQLQSDRILQINYL